jgi:ribulose-phosphate 3-epimerase
MNNIKIAPSLLSANFAELRREIESVLSAGADWLHFDVMDGHFVPNISVGLPVLESVRKITTAPIDVHLMITEPWRFAERFAAAGANIVSVHLEAGTPDEIRRTLTLIRGAGAKAGVVLKPQTPAKAVTELLTSVDLITVMTVEPGFGGQSFQLEQLPKLRELRAMLDASNSTAELEVDGGIGLETGKLCVKAGANVLVSGNSLFNAPDRAAFIRQLRG